MKIVLQRVQSASVTVGDDCVGQIEKGLLLFVGIEKDDPESVLSKMAAKVATLRVFSDGDGKTNLSVKDVGGAILAVSQFTLAGDCKKGTRPSFDGAEVPERAEAMIQHFVDLLRLEGLPVETGRFGAMMSVQLVNDGPFTLVLNS